MPTTNSYGAYNPAAVDPYPIESDLAKLAVGNSPENAANLLDLYQLQRTTDAANYGHEMGIQHDFAKQQLAQQLQENYMKYGQEALKTPGGVTLLKSQAPDALGPDFGPAQQGIIETSLANARDASTAEKAGSAAYHGLQAGFPANLTRLQGMSGGLFDTQGVSLQLQVEGMKQDGKNARAGGAAGDFKLNAQLPADPNSGLILSGGIPKGWTIPQYEAALKAKGYRGNLGPPGQLPDAGVSPAPGTTPGGSPPAKPAPNNTRLTPAPAPAQKGADVRASAERFVENNLRMSNNPIYKDIQAGKVGGKINMQRGADGRPVIKGATGTYPYIE